MRRVVVGTAAVAAVGLGTVVVAPAAAAAPSAAPQACSSSGGNFLAYIQGTQYDLTFCGPHTVTTAGTGPYVLIEDNAPNRIWFHQNANNSGWADCFRVQFASISLSGRDRNPGNIQVSANTAPC
jgi:hypothetical protein